MTASDIDRTIEFVLATWDAISILRQLQFDYPNDCNYDDDGNCFEFPGFWNRCDSAVLHLERSISDTPPVIRQHAWTIAHGPLNDDDGVELELLPLQLPLF